jgi:hypothetical protein
MSATMIYAISILTYFSGIGFVFSIVWSLNKPSAYKMLSMAAGIDLQKTSLTSPGTGKAMNFLLMDFTSQMCGMNLIALLIIWIPFRHGEFWAWAALWFYPVMFAWHYLHYAKGTRFSKIQIVYCILSSLALIITYSYVQS